MDTSEELGPEDIKNYQERAAKLYLNVYAPLAPLILFPRGGPLSPVIWSSVPAENSPEKAIGSHWNPTNKP